MTFKNPFQKEEVNNVDNPLPEEGESKANEQAEETIAEAEDGKKNDLRPVREDLNCEPCKGLGLLENGKVCSNCQGTGRVQ